MMALYNEIDPFRADILRTLAWNDAIAWGHVDERSLLTLADLDVAFHKQIHFCAGLGLWSLAFRWAGIEDDAQIWSFSLPCQPFSVSGARKGFDDDRHLWPALRNLIQGQKPGILCFEQTSSPLGLQWLDVVWRDLEAAGYRGWTFDLCAPLVGAPHQRQRLYGMAYADNDKWRAEAARWHERNWAHPGWEKDAGDAALCLQPVGPVPRGNWEDPAWIRFPSGKRRPIERGSYPLAHGRPEDLEMVSALGDAIVPQLAADFLIESMTQLCIEAGLVNAMES